MLLSFKVKNFRSIKDEIALNMQATAGNELKREATFENGNIALLRAAAIYGPNASGKSNLLKAMMVFKTMVLESLLRSNLPVDLSYEFFKLSTSTQNKPTCFEISFVLEEKVFTYGFEFNKVRIQAEWLKKGNVTLFKRDGQNIKPSRSFKDSSESLRKQTTEKVLFLSVLSSYNRDLSKKIVEIISKIQVILEIGTTLDYTFGEFLKNPAIAAEIKKFNIEINPGVMDIKATETLTTPAKLNMPDIIKPSFLKEDSPIAQRSMKFFRKIYGTQNKEVGIQDMDFMFEESVGTRNAFAMSGPIIDSLEKGNILFIDELNASLHPILCQYLITIFNSKKSNPHNAQLVFTTHDITLLDEQLLRRDQIYFTDKDKFGATELFSLADISERKGVSFAKRYLEGRYRAIPYIREFEEIKFSRDWIENDG